MNTGEAGTGDSSTAASTFSNQEKPSPSTASPPNNSAGTSVEEFGIEKWEGSFTPSRSGQNPTAAGENPNFVTGLEFNHYESGGFEEAFAATEDVTVRLPPGVLGNPDGDPSMQHGRLRRLR